MKEIKIIKPFKKMCMSIGILPSSYLESMTYYESLTWFTEYLKNTVIPALNNNAEAVEELQNLFIELQNYVNNYFINLDVQEEINKKLDLMASDGTLESIVANYINPYLNEFNTRLEIQDGKIQSLENLNPIPVSSTSEMTDTSKIYLNTTNGYWYFYNGNAFVQGGVYQALVLNDYIEDGIKLAYDIPKFDNFEWVLNTMNLTRASITKNTGALVSDQGGTRLRTGRMATFGSNIRGLVAKMTNSIYLIAPRWYSDGSAQDWTTVYIEGGDFGNEFYMGKHPFCAFVIKRADEEQITEDDINAIRQSFKLYLLTDKTLTKENVPADAKAVGEAIQNYTKYKDYQSGRINFEVKTNKNILINNESDSYSEELVKSVLMLPTSYSKIGKKTKLIMCCHGAGGTITDTQWYGGSDWYTLMNFLLSKGYAVFDTNRLNETANDFGKTYGSPLALEALYNAYNYIIENYNIDDKIYLLGVSMGGTTVQSFAYAYPSIVRNVSCFAPANTCYSIWRSGNSIRSVENANTIANCFGYNTREQSEQDGYKNYIGYCTALKIKRFNNEGNIINTDIVSLENSIKQNYQGGFWFNNNEKWFLDFPVPIKIWSGTADESIQTKFNECLIEAIRNAGGIGYIKLVEGGNHHNVCFALMGNMKNELDYWLKRY